MRNRDLACRLAAGSASLEDGDFLFSSSSDGPDNDDFSSSSPFFEGLVSTVDQCMPIDDHEVLLGGGVALVVAALLCFRVGDVRRLVTQVPLTASDEGRSGVNN